MKNMACKLKISLFLKTHLNSSKNGYIIEIYLLKLQKHHTN
jgi:hypothetical protein